MSVSSELTELQRIVVECRKCPRLVAYLEEIPRHKPRRFREWEYWSKPLPSFGDKEAPMLIVGLAPAAHGGNRTGRMFTGDRSGEWLFGTLHQFGFANQPDSRCRDDDFSLRSCYITATIRCAPPDNKPLPEEIENCRPYFLKELDLLKSVRVIVSLGQIAFIQTLKSLCLKGVKISPLPFGHGLVYLLSNGQTLICTYHPSQQNTHTGRLTHDMFSSIFQQARKILRLK